ncbi:MAG: tRNA-dihydrouridine synthase family protein [Nanoarchaeota archaeon]
MKLKTFKIGKLTIKNPILLAPMVDVTDLPYRLICKKAGADIVYTEMLYVDAIIHENKKTKELMTTVKEEKPIGIQITGSNIDHFKKAIPYLKNYDFVDLNCGCPSERIVGNEAGSYLLNNPKKIAEIIKLLKKEKLIVTVKIRLGFHTNNVLNIAEEIEKAGADALTIHARLSIHSNKIPADWKEIEKVKKILKIPVIGNGDIHDGKSAEEMLKITDGCMIARAAIGDPDIFYRIKHYIRTGEEIPFSFDRNMEYLSLYLKYCKKYKFNDLHRIKHLSCKFIRNIKNGSKLRNEIMQCKSLEDIENMIEKL